jgi:UDP-N-acetylmuramate: L-alanyl-gamma-D-glutamyl-meso-diaminopimelate ligase
VSLELADMVYCFSGDLHSDAKQFFSEMDDKISLFDDVNMIIESIVEDAQPGNIVVIMSNGGFHDIHEKLLNSLRLRPKR